MRHVWHVQEYEGQGAQLKHQSAVIHFEQLQLEGYGPFRSACTVYLQGRGRAGQGRAGQGRAGLGWAGLRWAGQGRAGLGRAGQVLSTHTFHMAAVTHGSMVLLPSC